MLNPDVLTLSYNPGKKRGWHTFSDVGGKESPSLQCNVNPSHVGRSLAKLPTLYAPSHNKSDTVADPALPPLACFIATPRLQSLNICFPTVAYLVRGNGCTCPGRHLRCLKKLTQRKKCNVTVVVVVIVVDILPKREF